MNYIIDGDIDFWKELNDDSEQEITDNICLLTNNKLTRNHITLPCGHKFNYIPIYNEILHSKQYQKYNKYPLRSYQMRCPYCRTTHNKLLLWIPHEGLVYDKLAAATIVSKCLPHKRCQYSFKSGKNKGCQCQDMRAYEDEGGRVFCSKHRRQYEKSEKKKDNKKPEVLTKHEKMFLKKHLKLSIQNILKQNNIPYKKSATKLVLMRTMQLHNIPLSLYDENHNEIILSTPMYSI